MDNNVLLNILPDILRNIIYNLPRRFDSHDVIDVLDQKYHRYYSELKLFYKDRGDERTADSIIAQALGRLDIIEKGEIKESENVNGNETPNHCWKKY